jgi:hypothetical protein
VYAGSDESKSFNSAMKEDTDKKSSEPSQPLTTERLCIIWEKILADNGAHKALERLEKAGFPMLHLKPTDATFVQPTWADYICALPLVPSKPSSRRMHYATSSRKYLPLVHELRELAGAEDRFRELAIFATRDYPGDLKEDLLKTASMLEQYFSWNYYVRHTNPRHVLIAELRWTIRHRTGKPHDRELNILFDAAFRAAGYKQGYEIDPTALDRIENRQREMRVKATRRLRERMNASAPSVRNSTRIRRNSRKRV